MKYIKLAEKFIKVFFAEYCVQCDKPIIDEIPYGEIKLGQIYLKPRFNIHEKCWDRWNQTRFENNF